MKDLNLLRDNKLAASTAVLLQLSILEAAQRKLTDLQDSEVIAKAAYTEALQEELGGEPEANPTVIQDAVDDANCEEFDTEPMPEPTQREIDIKVIKSLTNLKAPKGEQGALKNAEFNVPNGTPELKALYVRIINALYQAGYDQGIDSISVKTLTRVFDCSHTDIYALAGFSKGGTILTKPAPSTNMLYVSKFAPKGSLNVRFLPLGKA